MALKVEPEGASIAECVDFTLQVVSERRVRWTASLQLPKQFVNVSQGVSSLRVIRSHVSGEHSYVRPRFDIELEP
jgi:hypothetical protein